MPDLFLKLTENKIFSLLFISALTLALFYTGSNVLLFTISYILIILSLALVLKQRFYKPINISTNGIFISACLLLTWFAISIFPSQVKYLSLYNFFWLGSLIIVFLIFTFYDNKDQVWENIWPAILLLVLIWSIYGLIQYYYLHTSPNASFLNKNNLAALINLALIPTSGYFLLNEKSRPWKFFNNKILTIIITLLFLTTFVISSRGGSLSLILGLIILLSLLRKHIEKSQIYSLFTIIFIAFMLVYLSQYSTNNLSASFTEKMISLKDTSTAGNTRFILWKSLVPLYNNMPWYGLGLGSLWLFWPPYRTASETSAGYFAHNDYIQLTLEAGYPGIILLIALFIFILIRFIRALKYDLTNVQRVELVSLFAALVAFSSHSFFTYNFYVLPLLIIAGLYLGRLNQLASLDSTALKTFSALKKYFKPAMFIFNLTGLTVILCGYFLTLSLSNYYNNKAKELMLQQRYQAANTLFLNAKILTPIMDNPFFSHADLLRRSANRSLEIKNFTQAASFLTSAHENLDKAEKLNPLRPHTHHIRGLIYQREQPEKAKIEFAKALKLDPRYLISRINLATLLHQQNQLKKAVETLYKGVNYSYPVNPVMREYLTLFARYSREAGVESFALHLEANLKKLKNNKR